MIGRQIHSIEATLPEGVELVAVSKFHPVEALREAYDAGQRIFGESRVQELVEKMALLPGDIRWHFIGHLQTNKAKALIGRTALIESVDSVRLLELIDRLSTQAAVETRVLLQVHVAREETKFGFAPDELLDYFRSGSYKSLRATQLRGLMGMATNTDDTTRIRADFHAISQLFNQIRSICPDLTEFNTLSMGMSDDYPIAIEEGSNLVRVGTAIFGERSY